MLQLVLAYLFAAGLGVTVVYLARQNRKQGWRRPASKWFGVELEPREAATPAALGVEPEPGELLLPQLLQLNRELAAHGTPVKPEVESPVAGSAETRGARRHPHGYEIGPPGIIGGNGRWRRRSITGFKPTRKCGEKRPFGVRWPRLGRTRTDGRRRAHPRRRSGRTPDQLRTFTWDKWRAGKAWEIASACAFALTTGWPSRTSLPFKSSGARSTRTSLPASPLPLWFASTSAGAALETPKLSTTKPPASPEWSAPAR